MCWASGNGISPSAARPGTPRRGEAWYGEVWRGEMRLGLARHGLRWQHGGLTGLPCRLHWWIGRDLACRGLVWLGPAWSGGAWVTDGGTESFGFPCHPHKGGRGRAWPGAAWHGRAGSGTVGRGRARAADSSTGGFGSHCCSLWRADAARFGAAGRGSAGLVEARQSSAWHGLQTAARSFFGGSLLLSTEGRQGEASRGGARHVQVEPGGAGTGKG